MPLPVWLASLYIVLASIPLLSAPLRFTSLWVYWGNIVRSGFWVSCNAFRPVRLSTSFERIFVLFDSHLHSWPADKLSLFRATLQEDWWPLTLRCCCRSSLPTVINPLNHSPSARYNKMKGAIRLHHTFRNCCRNKAYIGHHLCMVLIVEFRQCLVSIIIKSTNDNQAFIWKLQYIQTW